MTFWIPLSLVTFAKPSATPPGSLVFVPPYSNRSVEPSPAMRFDAHDDDGTVFEFLLWLRGGPWGPDKAQRTVTKCQDFHSNDASVPALVPGPRTRIEVDIDFDGPSVDDTSWHRANGLVASGEFGARIVGLDHFEHRAIAYPIDVSTWKYDPRANRQPATHWYQSWRIRVLNDESEAVGTIPFELPRSE